MSGSDTGDNRIDRTLPSVELVARFGHALEYMDLGDGLVREAIAAMDSWRPQDRKQLDQLVTRLARRLSEKYQITAVSRLCAVLSAVAASRPHLSHVAPNPAFHPNPWLEEQTPHVGFSAQL